jgi:hypothetical protein
MPAICALFSGLVGCASPQLPPEAPRPMAPLAVDCGYSAQMAGDLESIIQQPANKNDMWDTTLARVNGIATPQQRLTSAKTVLWTVRSQCPGF